MKITVSLNKSSINNAIKQLQNIKRKIPKMLQELLVRCAEFVIERANIYLQNADRGENVKNDIMSSWSYSFIGNSLIIRNTSDKAVYVEFGVGIVGEGSHPAASEAGYDYNQDSSAKQDDGSWHFFANESDLDIPLNNVDWGVYGTDDGRNRMSIYTRGAVGEMYAYNALEDLRTSGKIKQFWKEIKEKHLK